jgi:hypothetical protein
MAQGNLKRAVDLVARAVRAAAPRPALSPHDGPASSAEGGLDPADVSQAVMVLTQEVRQAQLVDGAALAATRALGALLASPHAGAAAAALVDLEGTLLALFGLVAAAAAAARDRRLTPAVAGGADAHGFALRGMVAPALGDWQGQLLRRTVLAGLHAAGALNSLTDLPTAGHPYHAPLRLRLAAAGIAAALLDGALTPGAAPLLAGFRLAFLLTLASLACCPDARMVGVLDDGLAAMA